MCCIYDDSSIKVLMKRMILLIVVAWREIHVFILEISFFLFIKKNK